MGPQKGDITMSPFLRQWRTFMLGFGSLSVKPSFVSLRAQLLAMMCLGLAWLIPNHYPPWNSFYNESATVLALLLLFLALARATLIASLRMPGVACGAALAAVIPWLQHVSGLLIFSSDAWASSAYLLGLATAVAAGYAWAHSGARASATLLCSTTLAASVVSSLFAVVQGLEVGIFRPWVLDAVPGMRVYANLAQPNNLATVLGFGALSLLLLREQRHISLGTGALLLAVLILGAGLTKSRTALLFGPVILLGLFYAKRKGVELRTPLKTIVLATACHWLLAWCLPAIQKLLLLETGVSLSQRSLGAAPGPGSESVRLQMWEILSGALADSPWAGHGWLQVGAAQLQVADRYPHVEGLWLHGHNLFVDLLVWCGYPLGLLLCVAIIYWFVSRAVRVSTVEGVIGMLMISVLGVHAMLELPHHYAYFLIPAGLWIGMVEFSIGARGWLSYKWAWLPAGLTLALGLALWKDYPALEEDFRLMRFETLRIGTVRAAQPAPDAPFLSSLTAFLRFTRTTPVAGMSDTELADMADVVKRYPYAPSMSTLAIALALNGRSDEARTLFIKIRHIHGEVLYRKMKRDLRQQIDDGQTALVPLERSLP
jgi:O-antigen ligase